MRPANDGSEPGHRGIVTVMRKAVALVLAAGLLGGVSFFYPARAKPVGSFGAWSAYALNEKAGRLCYLSAVPGKSSGKYAKRGDIFMQITHRPPRVRNEVSVIAGYTYQADSGVEVEIDGKKFELFTSRDTAWSRDAKGDAALVRAMRAGATMIVRGTSSRGTLTTDTYSLAGFTKGHNAITKACGLK